MLMSAVVYSGYVVFAVIVAYGVRWFDPAVLSQLSRKSGLTARTAWGFAVASFLWMFLPILFGAPVDDSELWLFGAAFAGFGFYMVAFAVSSRDEYALFKQATATDPQNVTAGPNDEVVATADTPEPIVGDDLPDPASPLTGTPAVHVDWIVQQRDKVGIRPVWQNVATGVHTTPFTLGDTSIEVTPGAHRTFSNNDNRFTLRPGDEIPDEAAAFLASHPDLPDPAEMDKPLRFTETLVPIDEPVTVIGTATQAAEPDAIRLDSAPVDELLGTHTDHATTSNDDSGDSRHGEVILTNGDVETARRLLKKRVYWLGGFGLVFILAGQAVALWLAGVSVI
jgi:hypothetical protein